MTILRIPDPSLVVLIGAAGSGKSTFAARHFAPAEILSSDAFRALVSGDEGDQRVSGVAFAILHRELERRIRAGLLSVVDATNLDRRHRHELLRRATASGLPAVAVVLALPDAVVLSRNAARARRVAEDVVLTHLERVAHAIDGGLEGEGYATVWIGRTAEEVDALEIERVRPV